MGIFLIASAASLLLGILLGRKFGSSTKKLSPADVLSAYLEEELRLLVSKFNDLKVEDMQGKQDLTNEIRSKIQTARSIHNKLLSGSFESVHQKALHVAQFVTWDTSTYE